MFRTQILLQIPSSVALFYQSIFIVLLDAILFELRAYLLQARDLYSGDSSGLSGNNDCTHIYLLDTGGIT